MSDFKIALSVLLAVSLMSSACARTEQKPEPSKVVVATVNGTDITGDTFLSEYNSFKRRTKINEEADSNLERRLRDGVMERIIYNTLINEEAQKAGIDIPGSAEDIGVDKLIEGFSPARLKSALEKEGQSYQEWAEKYKRNLIVEKLILVKVAPMVHIPEKRIKKYFKEHPEEFKVPRRVHAYQIMTHTLSEADEIRNELLEGADFAEQAKKYSKSPDAADGGDLGIFARGQMPKEFDDILFKLKLKEISKVVASPYGYHVFKVVEEFKPSKMKYAEAKDRIFNRMFNEELEKKFKEWIEEIRKKADVVIYSERLYRL